MSPQEFRRRVERAFITIEGRGDRRRPEYGAISWFARTIQDEHGDPYHRQTIERYVQGSRPIPAPIVTLLRLLEWDADRVRYGDVRREVIRAKYQLSPLTQRRRTIPAATRFPHESEGVSHGS